MLSIGWRRALALSTFAALVSAAPLAHAQEAPDALVKRVSQEVLQIVRSDPQVQAGNEARIKEVIEVNLPRARNDATRALPEFQALTQRIWQSIRDEAYRAAVA